MWSSIFHSIFHGMRDRDAVMLLAAGGTALFVGMIGAWFGVNLDTGNFHTADPYGDLAKCAPYAVNVQVKVDMFPNNKKEPADLARVVKILRDANADDPFAQ